MIELVETPVTVEATKENPVTEVTTNTVTLKAPEPSDLLQSLMKLLDEHIEKKVAEAVVKHVEAIRDVAREIAEEVVETAMDAHAYHYDHDEYDRLANDLDDKISDALDDYDFDDKIKDALNDVDLEDKIKDTIRDMSFTVSVD
jgi:uncharacterized coiled-coil DUF342 family protein